MKLTYEEAMAIVGCDLPAWMLQDILERQPRSSRYAAAAMLLLKRKSSR